MNPFAVSELSSRLNVYTFEATAQQPHSAITECFAFPKPHYNISSVMVLVNLLTCHVHLYNILWVVFT